MDDAELARMRSVPKNGAWMAWGGLQIGMASLFAVAAVVSAMPGRGPRLSQTNPAGNVIDVVLPAIATMQVLSGLVVYVRNVVRGPKADGRAAKSVSARLLAARSASDGDRFLTDTVLLLDGHFLGASILSWALAEGGALLTGIYTLLRGFQPAGIAVVVLYLLSMVWSAPTTARRDRHRERLLRAAGLDDAQVVKLLASGSSS